MIKYGLCAFLFLLPVVNYAGSSFGLETVVEGLDKPYYMLVENGDLVVTVNGGIVRVHLGEQDQKDGQPRVSHIADVAPGPPSGLMDHGPDYVVVENITGSLLQVTRDGEISLITEGLGNPDEFARYGRDYIVVDIAVPDDDEIGNARLLRITPEGELSVLATEGLGGPAGIAIVGDTFWLTDFILGRLLKVTPEGEVTVVAQGLGQPLGIKYDGQDFLIADFASGFAGGEDKGRLLRVSKTGRVTVIASGETVGNPSGLTIHGPDIYFSDVVKGRIMKLTGYRRRAISPPFKQ